MIEDWELQYLDSAEGWRTWSTWAAGNDIIAEARRLIREGGHACRLIDSTGEVRWDQTTLHLWVGLAVK